MTTSGTDDAPSPAEATSVSVPERRSSFRPDARAVLLLVLLASVLSRLVLLPKPDGALIFDEAYYVNAARIILHLHVVPGAPYADAVPGLDPNTEHPPLGKVLIAGSMRLFGDDAFGWRIPSVAAGIAAVLLVYGVVRAVGGDRWTGTLAAALLTFDNLALVHSRIGSLDMMLVAFLLLGAWCALRGWPIVAGIAFALAALVKVTGILGPAAVVLYEGVLWGWARRDAASSGSRQLRSIASLILAFVSAWLLGLWWLDSAFSAFSSPLAHLQHIFEFGTSLTRDRVINQESYPWQWLANEVQMTYLRTDAQIIVNGEVTGSYPVIFFRGAMNPFVIAAAPLGVGFALWRTITARDRLGLWVVTWVAAMYLPFVVLALALHRVSYIFYFLPTLPAVAVGVALFLRRAGLPALVTASYLGAVLLGFVLYFPFRSFG